MPFILENNKPQIFEVTHQQIPKSTSKSTEVFYLDLTGEIFLEYQDYYEMLRLYKKKIWVCEITGKQNITFKQALTSEAEARKRGDHLFPNVLASNLDLEKTLSFNSSIF